MKFRKLFFGALCAMMVTAGFTSCSDDDNEDWRDGSQMEMADTRAYILNEGNAGSNNSNIIYFDWQEDLVYPKCIFTEQNGKQLGDTGNDIYVYGDKILVVVNVSNYVALLNGAGVEKSRISFETEEFKHLGQVRSITMSGNNAFGQIFISDTNREHIDALLASSSKTDYKLFNVANGIITEQ